MGHDFGIDEAPELGSKVFMFIAENFPSHRLVSIFFGGSERANVRG